MQVRCSKYFDSQILFSSVLNIFQNILVSISSKVTAFAKIFISSVLISVSPEHFLACLRLEFPNSFTLISHSLACTADATRLQQVTFNRLNSCSFQKLVKSPNLTDFNHNSDSYKQTSFSVFCSRPCKTCEFVYGAWVYLQHGTSKSGCIMLSMSC